MSVIKTGRNFVCAYEPLPEDCVVQTIIRGDPEHYVLLTQPISEYQQAVNFAVSMADVMAGPIEVITLTGMEFIKKLRAQREARQA